MTKYGWGAFCTDDFCKQYNADRLKEMNKQINHLEEELFARTYEGVPATPPAIKVGDKVRVCKARWVAEGRYAAVDERYLKEGTVVSVRRELNRYSDRDRTLYEVYFDPLCTIVDGHVCHVASVTLLASYKEIYSHKPKDARFTYMINRDYPTAVSNMDVASWYPEFMAAMNTPIGTVEKKEVSDDGVKFYISQPTRCGKDWATKIEEMMHKSLSLKYDPLPLKKHTDKDKTVKIMNGEDTMKTIDLPVKNIIHNGPCTIVFWMDNTKTIVKLKPGDTYDPHAAFCIAVAKKMYGSNSKISKIVDQFSKDVKVPETPTRELSVDELKAAADKIGYRVSRKPKKK